MGVPAALTLDDVPLHGLPSAYHVLEQPRDDVVDARSAVGRGRPLEEGEWAGTVSARLDGRLEGTLFVPCLHQGSL